MTTYAAIHLYRVDPHVIVAIEVDGKWIEVIRDNVDSPFSHIVEPRGIEAKIAGDKGVEE